MKHAGDSIGFASAADLLAELFALENYFRPDRQTPSPPEFNSVLPPSYPLKPE